MLSSFPNEPLQAAGRHWVPLWVCFLLNYVPPKAAEDCCILLSMPLGATLRSSEALRAKPLL